MPGYSTGWHHRVLCSALDRFAAGEIRRLMVFMPPQHGKSELVSRRLPAFILGRQPTARIITASYSADLASKMNRDVQRVLDGDAYRRLFPTSRLGGKSIRAVTGPQPLRNADEFEIVGEIVGEGDRLSGGWYKAAGVGGGITGRSMDFGIIDDPIKGREEAESLAERENVWGWYNGDFLSRSHNDTRILLTCTRWHPDDLAGRLLKAAAEDPKADQWEVVCFPAIRVTLDDPRDPRQPGEALWPERHSLASLEAKRAGSPYDWDSVYQQNPTTKEGAEFPREWFDGGIWFQEWPAPADTLLRVIALDPSKGKDARHAGALGDYSAFVVLYLGRDGTLYVDADLCNRRPTPKIVEDGIALYLRHSTHGRPVDGFAIEVNQFQELLASQFLRAAREHKPPLILPVYGWDNTINKEVRIRRLGPLLSGTDGRIRFKANSPGAAKLVGQLRDFRAPPHPPGYHDDGPDSLELAVRMLLHLMMGSRAPHAGSGGPKPMG